MWDIKTPEDVKKIFDSQLERLQNDLCRFLSDSLSGQGKMATGIRFERQFRLEEMNNREKSVFWGLSFHDDFDTFKKILTYRTWDFCQIQYNCTLTQRFRQGIEAMS